MDWIDRCGPVFDLPFLVVRGFLETCGWSLKLTGTEIINVGLLFSVRALRSIRSIRLIRSITANRTLAPSRAKHGVG